MSPISVRTKCFALQISRYDWLWNIRCVYQLDDFSSSGSICMGHHKRHLSKTIWILHLSPFIFQKAFKRMVYIDLQVSITLFIITQTIVCHQKYFLNLNCHFSYFSCIKFWHNGVFFTQYFNFSSLHNVFYYW